MSVASFTIPDKGGVGALTITPLGPGQDLLANVNRWRRQAGLPPVATLAEADPLAIDVGGDAGTLVDITGGEQRILAVVVSQPAATWFIKLTGPDGLLGGQRPAFEEFVRSLQLDGSSS
ncbi:MAG: hypothetical protein HKO59_16135 [Phycisphaerales bacterium]|nr:hypothetical protein [Phycisphaerales bacterium]NNM27481.1 hypothetical protein [Phycisphaerales bacterium]